MTPEQWQSIQQIFTKAAEIENPAGRAAYLDEACRGQAELRAEVESLLRQHDKPGPFLGLYSSIDDKTLSHYRVLERIGEGGMGIVYRALDTRLDRVVAIKVLPAWMVADPRKKRRLVREAKYASALKHPNVVTVHAIEQENGVDFIVMEHVAGTTLDQLIPPRGMSAGLALHYALQMAEVLAAAHSAGILHGDFKPRNIMVTEDGRVKLLDFGLAAAIASPDSNRGDEAASEVFGTRVYMAPEQLSERRPTSDPRSEIFSFGLVLHQMLSGRHAFEALAESPISEAIKYHHPNPLPAGVPASLSTLIEQCLQKDPRQRFQSMTGVYAALADAHPTEHAASLGAALTAGAVRATELGRIRALTGQIAPANIARSRRALAELKRWVDANPNIALRDALLSDLKEFILTLGNEPVTITIRELRKLVLELMRASAYGDLKSCFGQDELEYLDLYGMNFAGTDLSAMSFNGSFLVEATFRSSRLQGASFAQAYVRNVDFTEADLTDADFTDADWFNATGLMEAQLALVRRETLRACPSNVPAMHGYLNGRYGYPFNSWDVKVQSQIKASWREYLCPGGLCDVVADWLRDSPKRRL